MSANYKTCSRIVVPSLPASANVLRRKYRHPIAYKKYRDGWKRDIWYSVPFREREWLIAMARIGKPMRVHILVRDKKLYDRDNLVASVKPILDSLVNLELLANDSPDILTLIVEQELCDFRCPPETVISIEEAKP